MVMGSSKVQWIWLLSSLRARSMSRTKFWTEFRYLGLRHPLRLLSQLQQLTKLLPFGMLTPYTPMAPQRVQSLETLSRLTGVTAAQLLLLQLDRLEPGAQLTPMVLLQQEP